MGDYHAWIAHFERSCSVCGELFNPFLQGRRRDAKTCSTECSQFRDNHKSQIKKKEKNLLIPGRVIG
jgi:hypothetical protein